MASILIKGVAKAPWLTDTSEEHFRFIRLPKASEHNGHGVIRFDRQVVIIDEFDVLCLCCRHLASMAACSAALCFPAASRCRLSCPCLPLISDSGPLFRRSSFPRFSTWLPFFFFVEDDSRVFVFNDAFLTDNDEDEARAVCFLATISIIMC